MKGDETVNRKAGGVVGEGYIGGADARAKIYARGRMQLFRTLKNETDYGLGQPPDI